MIRVDPEFFADLMTCGHLAAFYGFENEAKLFRGIDHRVNFCLLVLSRMPIEAPLFSAFVRSPEILHDPGRVYRLTANDISVLNPNSRTCPVFRTRRDAEINLAMYRRAGVLYRDGESGESETNSWNVRFMSMFHMANDSGIFRIRRDFASNEYRQVGAAFECDDERYLPLYEAKMVYHFNHRFGDFALLAPGEREHILPQVPDASLLDATYVTTPRYWVSEAEVSQRTRQCWGSKWFLGWRDVTDARSSVRTVVPCIIPVSGVSGKFPLILSSRSDLAILYANLACFALDYAGRQKIGGVSLPMFVMKQFPVLAPDTYAVAAPWCHASSLRGWLLPRVLELTFTAWDLEPFARDVGYGGPPFRWDTDRRFLLRCELDAAFFHLYGLSREDTDYVMQTFPIVRKNEVKAHNEYRTRRVILEVYDAMAEAARTGNAYRTRLDPPPADPQVAHAPRVTPSIRLGRMPDVIPAMTPEREAAIMIWALLRARGGAIRRADLARAFALRSDPLLLTRLAPAALQEATQGWAGKVGHRTATHGLLERNSGHC